MDGFSPLLEASPQQSFGRAAKVAVASAMALAGTCAFWAGAITRQRGAMPARATELVAKKDPLGGVGAPLGKSVVLGMDTNINFHTEWDNWEAWSSEMEPFWTKDMVYDFSYVGDWFTTPMHGLRGWFDGEHMHYNVALPDCQFTDFIRAATNQTCTSASYGLARWMEPFAGVPPPPDRPWVKVRDLDFYLLEGERIKINWCIVDVVDLFMQAGYKVLPPAPMSSTLYMAPAAMDGYPAPLSAMVDPHDTIMSERIWRAALQEDYVLNTGGARWWAEDAIWYGPGGVGTAHSRAEYRTHFLEPLHAAFSNITMATDLVVCEGKYCGAHFSLHGVHTGKWLGEVATGKKVPIRFGAHARIEQGKIVQGWLILDIPKAFHAMGVDLFARARIMAATMAA